MIESTPKFIRGTFVFAGAGYDNLEVLAGYTIAADRRAQPIYFRAGNSCAELISLALLRDGVVIRLFPIGAKDASHVPLALVEDIPPGTRLDVAVAAPAGVQGVVVLDFGLVEI